MCPSSNEACHGSWVWRLPWWKNFALRFYGQNLANQHNTTTVHRWDIYYILGHLFLSYTWSKSRSCNSPMYHLISIAVSSLLSLVSPSGMPKSKPWDLPKIGIHNVNDVCDLDFPMKPPKLNPSRGLVFFVWTKYGIDVSFSLVCWIGIASNISLFITWFDSQFHREGRVSDVYCNQGTYGRQMNVEWVEKKH